MALADYEEYVPEQFQLAQQQEPRVINVTPRDQDRRERVKRALELQATDPNVQAFLAREQENRALQQAFRVNPRLQEQFLMKQAEARLPKAPPSGYRPAPDGNLAFIPGGPADPAKIAPAKAMPASAASKLFENQQNLRRAEQALALVEGKNVTDNKGITVASGDQNATGWKGLLATTELGDQALQRLDPTGVDTRAAIADLGSMIIHDRSGAAVTAAEYPRLRPFIPKVTDDAATAKKKLQRFATEYKRIQGEMVEFYQESGYKVPVESLGKSGVTVAPQPATAPSGGFADVEKERRYQEWKASQPR